MDVDEFLVAWRGVVGRWVDLKDRAGASHALLREVLDHGLAAGAGASLGDGPDMSGRDELDPQDALDCEINVLRLSGLVDEAGYIENILPRVRRPDPVAHFATRGWRELINPSRAFDVWRYWFDHLGLDENRVNPLLHYALAGRHEALSAIAPVPPTSTGAEPPTDRAITRACLFAAYDVDGIVDDYVVDFLRRLSKHCDVFYLADSDLSDRELAKLDGITVRAWSIPHGRYDFGSYAMLAQDLVGWERLDSYDEVLLANDSCYALMDFEHVFERMDHLACDWWGLQASKFDFARHDGEDLDPIPLEVAKERFAGRFEWRQLLHLHISSYFLALRRPAFQDPDFRRLFAQVGPQPDKTSIVLKYEIGLSRLLCEAGHDFLTYIRDLYPFHPVYNADAFELIQSGFPLLKRTFLVENSTGTPGLAGWRRLVLDLVPDAPVDAIERNLERVAPHDQLALSFSVVEDDEGRVRRPRLMRPKRLAREDRETPTFEHWWAFLVDGSTHQLPTDSRALLEAVVDDPSIKKIVLTRSRQIHLSGRNLELLPLKSPEGQHRLVRSGVIVVSGRPQDPLLAGLDPGQRLVVDVSAGSDLRRPTIEASDRGDAASTGAPPELRTNVGLSSSRLDELVSRGGQVAADYSALMSGSPRTDFVCCPDEDLPADVMDQVGRLAAEIDGRRLVLVAPTAPLSAQVSTLSDDQQVRLGAALEAHGFTLALREPRGDRCRTHARYFGALPVLSLPVQSFPYLEPLFRLAHALVSDDGAHLRDFLLTGRPAVAFSPDPASALRREQLVVPLETLLPGGVVTDIDRLIAIIDDLADGNVVDDRYEWCRSVWLEHADGHSSQRAATQLRALQSSRSTSSRQRSSALEAR